MKLWRSSRKKKKLQISAPNTFKAPWRCARVLWQLCLTLFDPRDCSPPGSSVHGIFQASLLEWVAILYSSGSFQPRDPTWVSCVSCNGRWIFLPWAPPGKPLQGPIDSQSHFWICRKGNPLLFQPLDRHRTPIDTRWQFPPNHTAGPWAAEWQGDAGWGWGTTADATPSPGLCSRS